MILNTTGTVTYMDNMGMNAISGKWEFQKNNTQFVISGIKVGESDLNTITKLTSTDLWFWHMDGTEKMIMHYKVK
jgi:VCBS repeat-containing protein